MKVLCHFQHMPPCLLLPPVTYKLLCLFTPCQMWPPREPVWSHHPFLHKTSASGYRRAQVAIGLICGTSPPPPASLASAFCPSLARRVSLWKALHITGLAEQVSVSTQGCFSLLLTHVPVIGMATISTVRICVVCNMCVFYISCALHYCGFSSFVRISLTLCVISNTSPPPFPPPVTAWLLSVFEAEMNCG